MLSQFFCIKKCSVYEVKLLYNVFQAEEEGANVDLDSQRKGKCAVIKTSTRQVKLNVFFYN